MNDTTTIDTRGRILLVDDDQDFRELYREVLARDGDLVETAAAADEALAKLDASGWDLVVLDSRLQGRFGPEVGLDLVEEIRIRAPQARVILVTGYASNDSVERGFALGLYDYLVKNEILESVLRIKARQALEVARERRLAALANGERDAAIRQLWVRAQAESNAQRKGALLEDLVALLFRSIPGFEKTSTDRASDDEQFDILVPNESNDPMWAKEGSYLLGECKHWSTPVDRREADVFLATLARRRARTRLGFFVAPGGATAGFKKVLEEHRQDDLLVVLLERPELEALVVSTDRNATLKELHQRAVLGSVRAR